MKNLKKWKKILAILCFIFAFIFIFIFAPINFVLGYSYCAACEALLGMWDFCIGVSLLEDETKGE